MSAMATERTHTIRRFAAAGILLALTGLLMAVFKQWSTAFFPAYRGFSKAVEGALATLFSIVPFSLWDILALALGVFILARLAWRIAKRRSISRWLANICVLAAALLLFAVGAWGLNHYAPPLSEELGLTVEEYSADELENATTYYLSQAAARARSVPRNDDMTLAQQDFDELASIAGKSYSALAQSHSLFEGSNAPVKKLLLAGEPLLYSGHTGIFWPITGEANVPENVASAELPFTMCHEAAHRLGIASEQEANFCAFLAASASDDARFSYAAYYSAFCYCLNALASSYPERAQTLIENAIGDTVDPSDTKSYGARLVLYDRACASEHYQAYEGPAQEAGTAANDAYLKAFSEESGVKSYGEVVDYLIAWQLAL